MNFQRWKTRIAQWSSALPATKRDLQHTDMKISELAGQLTELKSTLEKVGTEINARIASLEGQLANTEVPADAQATIESLKAIAKSLDDINPDAPLPS